MTRTNPGAKRTNKQHEKYSEQKTKKGSRENSFWQFTGTILEVKAGQITKWKKNEKNRKGFEK